MKTIMHLGAAAFALAVTISMAPVSQADPPSPQAPSLTPIPNTLGNSAGTADISVECNGLDPAAPCLVLTVIDIQGTAASADVLPTIFQNQPTPFIGADRDPPTEPRFGPVLAQQAGFFGCLLGAIISIGPYGTSKACT